MFIHIHSSVFNDFIAKKMRRLCYENHVFDTLTQMQIETEIISYVDEIILRS